MKPVKIHHLAKGEIREAARYYERERSGLVREFREEFEKVVDRMQSAPGIFAPIDDRGTRKIRFLRFPYTLYYLEHEDSPWISAEGHQKRRPYYWEDRSTEDTL